MRLVPPKQFSKSEAAAKKEEAAAQVRRRAARDPKGRHFRHKPRAFRLEREARGPSSRHKHHSPPLSRVFFLFGRAELWTDFL
jgi:hypothetical protein